MNLYNLPTFLHLTLVLKERTMNQWGPRIRTSTRLNQSFETLAAWKEAQEMDVDMHSGSPGADDIPWWRSTIHLQHRKRRISWNILGSKQLAHAVCWTVLWAFNLWDLGWLGDVCESTVSSGLPPWSCSTSPLWSGWNEKDSIAKGERICACPIRSYFQGGWLINSSQIGIW